MLLLLGCATAFYDDPVPDLDGYAPGELVRVEHIARVSAATLSWKAGTASPHGADVYRLMVRTEGLEGPDVATARLALPRDTEPTALVAHLHGTVGLADRCAPSRDGGFGFESGSNPIAARQVAAGRAVVAPDYLGLGPAGPHPYVAARPTATSVLDSLRGARELLDGDLPIALAGHSQGAHAALATLAHIESYAPELELAGALALSTPGPADQALAAILDEDAYAGFVALALVGLSSAHELELDELLLPEVAENLPAELEERCLSGLSGLIARPADELFQPHLTDALLRGDLEAAGLQEVFEAERLDLPTEVPTLLLHGTDDELFPPEPTAQLAEALGADIELVAGGDHLFLPWTARERAFAWLDEVLVPGRPSALW